MRLPRYTTKEQEVLSEVYRKIKTSLRRAPRNSYVAELCLQIVKWSPVLKKVKGEEFCEGVGLPAGYAAELSKMRKIAARLVVAGLDLNKL